MLTHGMIIDRCALLLSTALATVRARPHAIAHRSRKLACPRAIQDRADGRRSLPRFWLQQRQRRAPPHD
eukprot:160696-Prymnesium_polylepis.2